MRINRTGLMLVALLVAGLLSLLSWYAQRDIREDAVRHLEESLSTVLETTHHSVLAWVRDQKSSVRAWAGMPVVRQAAGELLSVARDRSALLEAPAQSSLRAWFPALHETMRYTDYFVVGPNGTNLASSRDENVGVENLLTTQEGFLEQIFAGGPALSPPLVSDVPLADGTGELHAGLPTMFVGAPIRSETGDVIAAFLFRLDPHDGFDGILRQGRIGQTGETYAFDRAGRLISGSRYDDQLRDVGLIRREQQAMLNILLLDPGVNLIENAERAPRREGRPLTRMAAAATAGEDGNDLAGYRDYRGVPVVGAWLWQQDLGLGIATEIDVDEAYHALNDSTRAITALTVLAVILVLGLTTIYLLYGQRRLAEAALRDRDALFSNLVEGVATDYLILRKGFDGTVHYASPAIPRFSGVTAAKAQGEKWWNVLRVNRTELARVKCIDAATAQGQSPEPFEMTYEHLDGETRTVEVLSRPEYGADQSPVAILAILKDVTERQETERKLRQAATVFEHTDEGIIVTDVDRVVIAVNGAFTRITGYSESDIVGQSPTILASGRHDQAFFDKLLADLDEHGEWRGEIWNRRKSGEVYPVWENITVVRDEYGHVVNYVALFSDISAIKETEERLAYLAHHDPLTGLANRLRFTANLEQALESAKRHRHKLALMYLDLDDFKPINDARGHGVGDQLLKLVSDRLAGCVRAEDTVARLGGDEFAIILTEIAHSDDAAAVASKVIEALGEPLEFGDQTHRITASVGISIYPDDADLPEGLLLAADVAMYRAKERRSGVYEFHSGDRVSIAGG